MITDYNEPDLIQCIRENVSRCCSADNERKRVKVLPLIWARPAQEDDILDVLPVNTKFTRVLAADTIWSEFAHDDQLKSVSNLLEKSASARFVVYCGFHTGRPIVKRFFERAEYYGHVSYILLLLRLYADCKRRQTGWCQTLRCSNTKWEVAPDLGRMMEPLASVQIQEFLYLKLICGPHSQCPSERNRWLVIGKAERYHTSRQS